MTLFGCLVIILIYIYLWLYQSVCLSIHFTIYLPIYLSVGLEIVIFKFFHHAKMSAVRASVVCVVTNPEAAQGHSCLASNLPSFGPHVLLGMVCVCVCV